MVGPRNPGHDCAEDVAENCQRRGIARYCVVSCGREKDGGQVMVGMGIGNQGLVAVKDSQVRH